MRPDLLGSWPTVFRFDRGTTAARTPLAWNAPWCGEPGSDDEVKDGVRPDMDPEPFYPVTVWAYDECDLTAPSRDEVVARVQQILRLEEQTAV